MSTRFYDTDLADAAWSWVAPVLPAARPGGRPRTTDLRAVLNAIFYLLRTGCQWRLLPREFPPWGTVYHYFQAWQNAGVWVHLHRVLYEQARRDAGRAAWSFGGRCGWPIGQDHRAWWYAWFRRVQAIRTVIADVGHQSRKLARALEHEQGWQLRIVRRRQRAFKITGLTWIVERSFAWLGRNRRLSKDYEYRVQTLETMIDLAAIRLMLNRIAPGSLDETFQTSSQSDRSIPPEYPGVAIALPAI